MAVDQQPKQVDLCRQPGFRWQSVAGCLISLGLTSVLLGAEIVWTRATLAQVIPDASLPVNSIVAPDCKSCIIVGGTARGNNLFHSFREFSIPTGGLALFNNAASIQNILVRVTGGTRSSIEGLLVANGSANLFLLNPAGITFGANAQIGVGGSFLATTGSSFKFADGSEFSATNPQAPSLLAVNVPVGLQIGGAKPPGDLQVQGTSLAVPTGKTLALVGGDVTILGSSDPLAPGIIAGGFPYAIVNGSPVPTTPGGRVELWAVKQGEVAIDHPKDELTLSAGGRSIDFGRMQLAQRASVNVTGTSGGAIQVQAGTLRFSEGSYLASVTLGDQPGQSIQVSASESFEIAGRGGYRDKLRQFGGVIASREFFESGLYAISFGQGAAGDITINTPSFTGHNGAYILTSNLSGEGGAVTVNAPVSVYLNEALMATTTGLTSSINSLTESTPGSGSRLTINTGTLRLENTSFLSTISFSTGRGGDLIVNATDTIDLSSGEPLLVGFSPSAPTAGGLFSSSITFGDAGNITLSTQRLIVRDGAAIIAGSNTQKLAGVLTIYASDSITVFGGKPRENYPSQITAGAYSGSLGNGGNLNITTGRLTVRNGGEISVQARGSGSAGTLRVMAETIALDTEGQINGTTGSGTGGNLNLQANLLSLRNGSRIRTDGGASNGGNITIRAGFVVAQRTENSDITANALTTGTGGRVNIMAQGIYGLQFQPQLTSFSDITASSQLGINGTVILNIPNLDPSRGTIELPVNLTDSAREIAQTCSPQYQGNRFVVTGRGGLSADPAEVLDGTLVWVDAQGSGEARETRIQKQERERAGSIVEITGWVRKGDGSTELVSQSDRPIRSVVATCQTLTQIQKPDPKVDRSPTPPL